MEAVITGASKGIGRAIAFALAEKGYSLALIARGEIELRKMQQEFEKEFPQQRFFIFAADCGNKESLESALGGVLKEFTTISVIVNNVGTYVPAPMMSEDELSLTKMIDLNLLSAYRTCRLLVPGMAERRSGHIFNICSVASTFPVKGAGSYSVSKYALYGFTANLREELKPYGIKVTAVLPASTLTDSWKGTDIPAEKFILPEDIASAIVASLDMSAGAMVEEIKIGVRI